MLPHPRWARTDMGAELDAHELKYPCTFPVKVFLKPDAADEAHVESLVRAELAAASPLQIQRSLSSSGAYTCLTLSFTATDAEQIRRIGAALRDTPGVLLSI